MEKGGYIIWIQCVLGLLIIGCSANDPIEKSITCYECNSLYDPRCGEKFDPYTLGYVNCSMKRPMDHLRNYQPTLCRKLTQKVQGKTRVVRGCGYIPDEPGAKECIRRTGTHDVIVEYCSCKTNLCNSGYLSRPSIKILSSAIITTIIYLFVTS